MADNTVKILLLVVILLVLGYVYQQNKTPMFIGPSGEAIEKAAEEIVHRDCSGTEYIIQKQCSRNGIVLDGLSDEKSGAGFETHVLDKNHEGFVRQLGDGVCPPKLVECNVDPPKPCSGNTWLDAMCVRLDVNGNELVLEDGNADACGDGLLKQTLDTNALDYAPATKGGLCTFERSGACQKTCPEPQPPVCNYTTAGWQNNDLGCVKSQDDFTRIKCGETGVIQQYKAATMNTEYCKDMTRWVSCSMEACPRDCKGSWSDWSPNPDACDVQPSESRIYSITQEAVGNTQYGYGRPCEEIHDKQETRSRQDPIQPCCTQTGSWIGPIGGVCSPLGTGKFIQTTKGQCPEELKSQIKPCCYEKGDWEKDGGCDSSGIQKYVQTVSKACKSGTGTKEEACCYKTDWVGDRKCDSDGMRSFTREATDACAAVPLEQNKQLCDSELARLKMIQSKEGVEGVRYVWFGFDNKTEYLNIAGIEIYSGGENIVKDWAVVVGEGDKDISDFGGSFNRRRWQLTNYNASVLKIFGDELKKKVTVNSSFGSGDSATGDYGTRTLFDGNINTLYHSEGKPNDWIKIDLGKEYTIDEVKVFNRKQCNACNNRWEGAVLKLLGSSENVIVKGDPVNTVDTDNGIFKDEPKTYSFTANPDTLAKLEDVMDVVPADFTTIGDAKWRKLIPACAMTQIINESKSYKEEPCQYVGEWDERWGVCDGSKQYKSRKVKNASISVHAPEFAAAILNPPTSQSRTCSHCKGEWKTQYGGESAMRMNRTKEKRHKRQVWTQYFQTKAASNGGSNSCPAHGLRKDQWEQHRKNGDFDHTQHVKEYVTGA